MTIKLRGLHGLALFAGVQFVYVCRFYSADLSKKSPGRRVWETMDVSEAMRLWAETTGAEHDQGQFTLSIEASIGQAGAIPRVLQPKQSDNLDFWKEDERGVPAGLPAASDVRPADAIESGSAVSGAGGGEGAPVDGHGNAT